MRYLYFLHLKIKFETYCRYTGKKNGNTSIVNSVFRLDYYVHIIIMYSVIIAIKRLEKYLHTKSISRFNSR